MFDVRSSLPPVRFGWSMLAEMTLSVRAGACPDQPEWIRKWWHDVRATVPTASMSLLAEATPRRGFIPEFLLPSPTTGVRCLDDELHALVNSSATLVRSELMAVAAGAPNYGVPAAAMPLSMKILDQQGEQGYLAALAEQMQRYWKLAMEPNWPSLRRSLDRELRYRGRILAEEGATAALERLHNRVAWRDGLVVVERPGQPHSSISATALRCTASVFLHQDVITGAMSDGTCQIHYAVRGVGAAWEQSQATASDALAALLGGVRAALLADLEQPTITSDLARQHGLSASTVSYHLGVLFRAGLLERDRDGKEVHYHRSAIGNALID